MTTLRSNGEIALAVYVAPHVIMAPPRRPCVTHSEARVAIVDPRHTSTVELRALSRRAGPRNQDLRALRPAEPRVELPDRRPLTRAQRVIVPQELVARWRSERREQREGTR